MTSTPPRPSTPTSPGNNRVALYRSSMPYSTKIAFFALSPSNIETYYKYRKEGDDRVPRVYMWTMPRDVFQDKLLDLDKAGIQRVSTNVQQDVAFAKKLRELYPDKIGCRSKACKGLSHNEVILWPQGGIDRYISEAQTYAPSTPICPQAPPRKKIKSRR